MSELYLILHKVRGEPAFDIAEKMEVEGEEWWIIPTSGHRAYPVRDWSLYDLVDASDINRAGFHDRPIDFEGKLDLTAFPDHYQVVSEPKAKSVLDKIVSALTPKQKLIRRV